MVFVQLILVNYFAAYIQFTDFVYSNLVIKAQ